ncbi:AMP-binding protein [Microvirga tunisiensis]|uniref:AMP-binding protein n=1 Tax=Pannonibacter tanglangensis TaxID=2750084 RepID=A0A7X5F5N3_9HYPH|nr:AMP-binding protein [Pannonibacter sp. XCT-53]NBN80227.1 AMP-binding protein [Pannonibacter sp. XCT-53]
MNLTHYCLSNAAPAPGDVALELVGPGGAALKTWTYGRLEDTILRVAGGLRRLGLSQGDRILVRIGHSCDFPLVFFGAMAGGFVPVPSSSLLTPAECDLILADSGAVLVVHDGATALPADRPGVRFLGPDGLAALRQGPPAAYAQTGAEDPAFLIYTSGTSGYPKGVLHAHRAARGRRPMDRGWYGLQRQDRLLHAGAFNWTYTLGVGLMDPWANGATSLVYDGPRDPQVWPDVLAGSRATLFAAVPSLYRRILKYGEVTPAAFPALRHGLTAGEALPAALHGEWLRRSGRPLYEALGMSEISTYVSSGPEVSTRPGSPGKPQAGRRVAVLAEDGEGSAPLPPGSTGLLAVHRSDPGLMLGYFGRPAETAAAFRGDWFLTGDRARFDAEGYLWYEGRADDVMNAFGYRVAPEEVERVLAAHPAVAEVAVTTVRPASDASAGTGVELIAAFVVLRDGMTVGEAELADHAARGLAEYKRPKLWRLVAELPRTASGKIQRRRLQDS